MTASTGEPLRVLLINGNYADGSVGGTQTFTENLAEALREQGHAVGVICHDDRDHVQRGDGVTVYRLRHPRMAGDSSLAYLVNQTLAIHNPAVRPKVRRAVKDFRPDVCHVQMLRRLTPAALGPIFDQDIPVVQTVHEQFSLWNFNAYQRDDPPHLVKLYSRRPAVVTAFKHLHRRISSRVDAVCAPSEAIFELYQQDRYFPGVPATVIPNAVPFEWGDPIAQADRRRSRADRPGPTRLAFLGRLDRYKGVDDLLAAFDRLPQTLPVELHVAGEGPQEDLVRAHAERDSRIVFHGPLRRADRVEFLRRADLLVCPSTWVEAFGLVVIEAFAAGLPVVATRAGALPELVADGVSGLIVPPHDPDALSAALSRLLDREVRLAMGANAARAAAKFSQDLFLSRQLDVYRDAMSRHDALRRGRR